MSQMPSKIWLHKDTKYSTGDIVCGYQYDFVQGIEDEGGIENFVEYVPADAFIEKAKKWFEENFGNRLKGEITTYEFEDIQSMFEDYKNYMKGE